MTDAPDLFSWRARSTDPIESVLAGAKTNVERTRALILHVLPSIQPASDEAIYEAAYALARCTASGIRSRRCELAREGLIVEGPKSRTDAGNACRTWRVVEVAADVA